MRMRRTGQQTQVKHKYPHGSCISELQLELKKEIEQAEYEEN